MIVVLLTESTELRSSTVREEDFDNVDERLVALQQFLHAAKTSMNTL